ncbi:hypothetical protein HYO65_gp153 [Tenacibaculum phage PTm1]|uniref:Uncharacterized protein n=2 Tax=Shirahamavirus PTm1 TaxID=2846435 RepID=A0A5S9HX93_9CAUD|nr:hypothetical protein HYO65_gp153 [Tenacibaculum phage PTm1]BBI90545.1 hypothetical protein [Tenacibaculum phage PTm1]BBI90853.1 hypothetical protein [Tenacibaculum phage PTm5]
MQEVSNILNKTLDEVIEWYISSDIYTDDISELRDNKPKITSSKQKPYGSYNRRKQLITICSDFLSVVIKKPQVDIDLHSYYLPKLGRYIEHAYISNKSALFVIVLHEVGHHIQNLRRKSIYQQYIHRVSWLNDRTYSNGKSIKTIECETTYNELVWFELSGNVIYIQEISNDRDKVREIFKNSSLKIEPYVWSGTKSPRTKTKWCLEYYCLHHSNLELLSKGFIKYKDEVCECKIYKNNSKSNSSYVFHMPAKSIVIKNIRYKNMSINKTIGSVIKNLHTN